MVKSGHIVLQVGGWGVETLLYSFHICVQHSQFVEEVVLLPATEANLQEEEQEEGEKGGQGGELESWVKWHHIGQHPAGPPPSTSSPGPQAEGGRRSCGAWPANDLLN